MAKRANPYFRQTKNILSPKICTKKYIPSSSDGKTDCKGK
jgi:hypothetical protein